MSSETPPEDDEVGYGRPPVRTRFQPGQSGNPKGRPKGRRGPRAIFADVLQARVNVRRGDSVTTMSRLEVCLLTLSEKAMKGDPRTLSLLLRTMKELGMTGTPEADSTEGRDENDAAVVRAAIHAMVQRHEQAQAEKQGGPDRKKAGP